MSSWVFGVAFNQELAYWVLALSGTILFVVKVLLLVFGGDLGGDVHGGGDVHVDVGGGDGSHAGSDAAFALLSLQSVLAFFMGSGWMGLACLEEWHTTSLAAFLAAMGFGFFLMLLNAGMMFGVNKLNQEVTYDLQTAIGHIGKVYLHVPAKGQGMGQVEVTVSGRRKILRGVSQGDEIESGALVKVVEVEDGQILVVEPQE